MPIHRITSTINFYNGNPKLLISPDYKLLYLSYSSESSDKDKIHSRLDIYDTNTMNKQASYSEITDKKEYLNAQVHISIKYSKNASVYKDYIIDGLCKTTFSNSTANKQCISIDKFYEKLSTSQRDIIKKYAAGGQYKYPHLKFISSGGGRSMMGLFDSKENKSVYIIYDVIKEEIVYFNELVATKTKMADDGKFMIYEEMKCNNEKCYSTGKVSIFDIQLNKIIASILMDGKSERETHSEIVYINANADKIVYYINEKMFVMSKKMQYKAIEIPIKMTINESTKCFVSSK